MSIWTMVVHCLQCKRDRIQIASVQDLVQSQQRSSPTVDTAGLPAKVQEMGTEMTRQNPSFQNPSLVLGCPQCGSFVGAPRA